MENIILENNHEFNDNVSSNKKIYATGKRKDAIARVWIKKGSGVIKINNRDFNDYFPCQITRNIASVPLVITDNIDKLDIVCTISGGGFSGQAGALRHGISKALDLLNHDEYHIILRSNGLLTRDSRVVERKKYGRSKARKSFQFSKR